MNSASSTDHFAEAQRLLGVDAEDWTNAERLARAQVHATLALAAAVRPPIGEVCRAVLEDADLVVEQRRHAD